MEALTQRVLLGGRQYDSLFPLAVLTDSTVKKGATVYDTVKFIPQVVHKTRWQLERFVNRELKGLPVEKACEKLWYFVKNHIAYRKDERGKEQIRSPRRLWHDRVGDCDCFTVFISGALSLVGIPVINRITKYDYDHYQHIYPIVPLKGGGYITMDCVVDQYNYEEPFSDKKDYPMELQFLDGIDGHDMGAINLKDALKKVGTTISNAANKVGETLKEGLHVVNKINPATLLLRAGVLASMKLNLFNVAGRLKWAYLSEEAAKSRGADKAKYDRLKGILTKLENIFHTAGGEPKNLKEAILTGNGNKDKSVSGLGSLDIHTPLSVILGWEVMESEKLSGFRGLDGLGQLGEPATAAAIASATAAIGALAALLKEIGNVFPKGSAGAKDFDAGDNDGSVRASAAGQTTSAISNIQDMLQQGQGLIQNVNSLIPQSGQTNTSPAPPPFAYPPVSPSGGYEMVYSPQILDHGVVDSGTTPPEAEQSFWNKNKKWLLPTAIVGGGLLLTAAGVAIYRSNQRKKKSLSGLESIDDELHQAEEISGTTHKRVQKVALM